MAKEVYSKYFIFFYGNMDKSLDMKRDLLGVLKQVYAEDSCVLPDENEILDLEVSFDTSLMMT